MIERHCDLDKAFPLGPADAVSLQPACFVTVCGEVRLGTALFS